MKKISVLVKALFCGTVIILVGIFNPLLGFAVGFFLAALVIRFEKEIF